MTNPTQQQKILTIMCQNQDRWFFPYDFMKPDLKELFVGYEASARLSELTKKYPLMFLSENAGKYIRRKLNMADYATWYHDLPHELQIVFMSEQGSPAMQTRSEPAGKAVHVEMD